MICIKDKLKILDHPHSFLWLAIIILTYAQLEVLFSDSDNMPYKLAQRIDKLDTKIEEINLKQNVDRDYFTKVITNIDTETELIKLRHEIMPACFIGQKTN
jgi:hypothetical protein